MRKEKETKFKRRTNLMRMRLDAELTQEQLAIKCEIKPANYQNFELGRSELSFYEMMKIADFFQVWEVGEIKKLFLKEE